VSQERDRHDGLTETHLVSKNSVDAVLVQLDQPVEAFFLIWSQFTSSDEWRLSKGFSFAGGLAIKGLHRLSQGLRGQNMSQT
jgi:hypothetical protein